MSSCATMSRKHVQCRAIGLAREHYSCLKDTIFYFVILACIFRIDQNVKEFLLGIVGTSVILRHFGYSGLIRDPVIQKLISI